MVDQVDPGPAWTRELLMRTAVMHEEDVPRLLNPDVFFAGGYEQMLRHLEAVVSCGFNLRTATRVLEIGCGSARLIRHLRAVRDLELVGCDIIADSIDWCRSHVPGVDFHANAIDPPLEFAAGEDFDLIFAQSVFTHIPLEKQEAWLAELARVLRPGGYAAITMHGRSHRDSMLDENARGELSRRGSLSVDSDDERASASTKFTRTWDVFQTRPVILRTFGLHFDVLDYQPGGQDLLVLRKPLDTSKGTRYVVD